jgi:CheY-like chemotaxis protein
VAITDTDMPFMDGHATALALKKINPRLKIIMASGSVLNRTGKESPEDQNINAFAPKPYTVEKLLTVVHDVLTARESG